MSTVTTPAEQPDAVTWRDAVTPLSRASRQRWTVAYAILLALLASSAVGDTFAIERTGIEAVPLLLLVGLAVVFGMLRRGTRRIAALDHPDLDERDVAARNSAYRIAFPLLVLVVIAALVLLAASAPDQARTITIGSDGFRDATGVFVEWPALTGLGLWIMLWAVFLPTGVLAWLEPDQLEPETSTGGLPDALRDGLLGLALAGGLAASLVADSDIGVVAFVAVLALLGALGRRANGQPVISRERMWRVAIGVVTILVVMAIGVASRST
ncbi:MAG: hypothetical protein QOJ89_3603 [bacterium]|jgi:hypothetical protein